ncbi:MAG: DUF1552 domain-containing protein [Rubripirellula sp.]|nr:DUF1552 domain-containing protein [Rubripirellula sp.]
MKTTNRRRILVSTMATIGLPSLESFAENQKSIAKPKTFVAVGSFFGWYRKEFYPKEIGKNYTIPKIIAPIADHRNDFTIFSGLDHRAKNGHVGWVNFLCGKNLGDYSLDQRIADKIGQKSRFPSLQLAVGGVENEGGSIGGRTSFTQQKIPLPMMRRPSVLYSQLFVSESDKKRAEYILRSGKSSLDYVLDDAKYLQRNVSQADRNKLDEYFHSLRSVEKRLNQKIESVNDVIAQTDYRLPDSDSDPISSSMMMEAAPLMYDLMALAIQTEAAPVMSLMLNGLGAVFTIDGEALKVGYHSLSHHGNKPEMIRDLLKIECELMKHFNDFLTQLKEKKDAQGKPLLDSTVVLLGTGMGDASRHANDNLPALVAGGGFDHGSHVSLDPNEYLLGDLYITLMNKMGVKANSFSNASRSLNEVFV